MALKVARVGPPSGGIDLDSGPAYVAPMRGADVSNFLPGRSGKLEVRGNLQLAQIGGTVSDITGLWRNGSRMLAGRAASGYSWDASLPTSTPSAVTGALIGPSYVSYAGSVYGVPGATSATTLLRWYLSGSVETIATNANAPVSALAVTAHLDRLFVLGGSKPGTTTPISKRSLYWTDPLAGADLAATLAVWQDDASGLVNEIKLDGSDSDYGVGLARMNGALVILRRRSLDLLTGQTPANFSQRRVLLARGCTSTMAIVEYGGGCYYMSEDGLTWFDGVDTRVQSDLINSAIIGPRSDLSRASLAILPRGFLFLVVPSVYVGVPSQRFLFHIPTASWSRINHANPWSTQETMLACAWDGEAPGPVFAGPDTLAVGNVTVPV